MLELRTDIGVEPFDGSLPIDVELRIMCQQHRFKGQQDRSRMFKWQNQTFSPNGDWGEMQSESPLMGHEDYVVGVVGD